MLASDGERLLTRRCVSLSSPELQVARADLSDLLRPLRRAAAELISFEGLEDRLALHPRRSLFPGVAGGSALSLPKGDGMHSVSPSERGSVLSTALASPAGFVIPGNGSTTLVGSRGLVVRGDEPYRPMRNGDLRALLDEEFSRNYRFEGLSDFFHDLKGLLRKVVVREEESEGSEFFTGPHCS